MDFTSYNAIVKQWIQSILDNRDTDAQLTLKACNDIIEYGKRLSDPKLIGFGYYQSALTYYGLNDGDKFFDNITGCLGYLEECQAWEYVARAYNILGITAINRGNAPIAFDYYLNGINYCKQYSLPEVEVILNINCGNLNLQTGRYEDALSYYELAYEYMKKRPEDPYYHSCMICIDQNKATCLVKQGQFSNVAELFADIRRYHWEYADISEKLGVLCAETYYYHRSGQIARRDECIAQINSGLTGKVAIMDLIDDFYLYCDVLIECGKDAELWHFIDVIEPVIKSFNITYLQLMEISMKIKYYKRNKQYADYLQAAGLYFELSERQKQETLTMVDSVLQLRGRLEASDQKRRQIEAENEILEQKSYLDALTGLPNRAKLNDFADQAFARALEGNASFAIEILDIDYFKQFNDNYGHQAGDECLKAVAGVIKDVADEHGIFGSRYGGDEFVLIYENVTDEAAENLAAELKKKVLDLNLEHKYSKALPIVTISQGICHGYPVKGQKVWDYLHLADDMLYKMKKNTRNDYCLGKY